VVARNVLSNWINYFLSGVISFFLSPFIVRHLGDTAYGVWVLLVSLTGYLGFLDLDIRGAVTRYVAKFHTEGNDKQASQTVSSAFGLFLAAACLAFLASGVFAIWLVPTFKIAPAYQQTAQIVVLLAGAAIGTSLINGVFGGVLVGLQRFEIVNAVTLCDTVLRSASIIIALRRGYGLLTLSIIHFSFSALNLLVSWGLSRHLYRKLELRVSHWNKESISLIFSFSFFSFLLHASNYLIFYTDALVIGAFLPVSRVTYFAIAGNLINFGRDLVSGFTHPMTPMASKLEALGDHDGLQRITLKAARYCTMLILPILLTFMIRGKTFIALWMGPAYAADSGHVLWILSLPWLLNAGTSVGASVMLGISRHKPVVLVAIAEGLTNLGLSMVLVKSMDIVGVAWGTALPNLMVSLFFWPWYVRRVLNVPLGDYVSALWLRPGTAIVPFALCSYAAEKLWPVSNLAFFFLQVVSLLPIAALGAWIFCFTPEERRTYGRAWMTPLRRTFGGA